MKDSDEVQYAHAEDSDYEDVLLMANTQSNTEQNQYMVPRFWMQ